MAGATKVKKLDLHGTGVPYLWILANQSDTAELTNGVCQGILVLEDDKNVKAVCVSPDDDAVTFTAIPKGTFIPGAFIQVWDTGTNATNVYCAYSR